MTKNSIATARLGAEQIVDLSKDFADRLAFAQGETVSWDEVKKELEELKDRVETTINQSTFNGDSLVTGNQTRTVVTGVSRSGGNFSVTTVEFEEQDLRNTVSREMDAAILAFDEAIANTTGPLTNPPTDPLLILPGETNYDGVVDANGDGTDSVSEKKSYALRIAEFALQNSIDGATNLGIAEKTVELQKDFLDNLTDQIDEGVGAMVDADMEKEAARLQALQVQQQLSTQALSIANQAPQNIMSLFR